MLSDGIDGSGFGLLAWTKGGGYYLGEPNFISFSNKIKITDVD